MTRLLTLIFALAVAAHAMPAFAKTPELADAWNGSQINWRDLKSGIREASQTSKPVIMVFHASWCSACKKYREVFKNPDIVGASRDFVMILVDADADKVANGAFAPDGTYVPRTIFLTSDGDIRTDLKGTTDPEHPQTIDINGPAELLSLMRKGRPPASAPNTADRADGSN